MPARYKSGQILVLVLLVVVVALAVGLSVASRNITNLRSSTQTEQSQRAFSAAEGGVEDILSKLNTLKTDSEVNSASGKSITVPVGDLSANVIVKAVSTFITGSPVIEGQVAQIYLDNNPTDPAGVRIEWAKKGTNEEREPASLYVNIIYQSGSTYADYRQLYSGGWAGEDTSNEIGTFNATNCTSADYAKCADITFASLGISNPLFLRIRPYWSPISIRVSGANVPVQNYEITSTASTAEGVSREVKVVRHAYPVLPAAFDYALYSEGGIVK